MKNTADRNSGFMGGPISRVFDFNTQVVGVVRPEIAPMTESETQWLRQALEEEADELEEARYRASDRALVLDPDPEGDPEKVVVGQVDACIDAAIFALGGLARLGLSKDQALSCFHAVMDANFEKKAGVKPGRTGAQDVVKPEGWVSPEERIKEILYGKR